MFIKAVPKRNKQEGKTFYQYKLVESQKVKGRKYPRHNMILNLGHEPYLADKQKRKELAACLEALFKGQDAILYQITSDKKIQELAFNYYDRFLKQDQRTDNTIVEKPKTHEHNQASDWQTVDINNVQSGRVREIGAEWLCYQACDQLELGSFLKQKGLKDKWVSNALISIISRAVYCASEHRTAEILGEQSGLERLFNRDYGDTTRHHLYSAAQKLYQEKESIENYLAQKTGELFSPEDTLMLYDLTNTYFEGEKQSSQKARFGKSKEKRNDARLIVLAIVVDTHGFIKYSRFYRGNIKDDKTLSDLLTDMNYKQGENKNTRPVAVIDAGIATEDNLKMLVNEGYDYLCVALSKPKNYEQYLDEEVTKIQDQRKQTIEVQRINHPSYSDQWLCIKSPQKGKKEEQMYSQARERFENELANIQAGVHKKGGIKQKDKVMERIGRAKEKYPKGHPYFEIAVKTDEKGDSVKEITWKQQTPEKQDGQFGIYFLRTTLKDQSNKTYWHIYNLLKEIEYTNRVLKTDLKLRPIYHITDEHIESHLFLGILAYQLVCTIRHQLKAKGLHYDWRRILAKMSTQKITNTTLRQESGTLHIQSCSKPSPDALDIYKKLNYQSLPFKQRKIRSTPSYKERP